MSNYDQILTILITSNNTRDAAYQLEAMLEQKLMEQLKNVMGSPETTTSSKTANYSDGLKEVKSSPVVAHTIFINPEDVPQDIEGSSIKDKSDPPERVSEPSIINQLGQDITHKEHISTFDASLEAVKKKFGF